MSSFISIVVPLYNEQLGITSFHKSLVKTLITIPDITYEIIYCDDGSTDNTLEVITSLVKKEGFVRIISLSRNFGKEYALTAGIHNANGDAIVMIDGDGQHPVELLGSFIQTWKDGAQIVVGVRKSHTRLPLRVRFNSWLFYSLFNRITRQKLVPSSTDFRLINSDVRSAFLKLQESNRITRGLIDWLGFKPAYISFVANERQFGKPSYDTRQLIELAINSFISLSPRPLYIFGYVGIVISILSAILGCSVIIEQFLLHDPLYWHFSGTAMLGIVILFLVGIVLMSQGVLSLYVSHIHTQSKRRPLYIVDYKHSIGIDERDN